MIARLLLAVAFFGLASAAPILARENLDTEQMLQEVLMTRNGEATGGASSWAILPQVGFSPDKGPKAGLKYTHRDFMG